MKNSKRKAFLSASSALTLLLILCSLTVQGQSSPVIPIDPCEVLLPLYQSRVQSLEFRDSLNAAIYSDKERGWSKALDSCNRSRATLNRSVYDLTGKLSAYEADRKRFVPRTRFGRWVRPKFEAIGRVTVGVAVVRIGVKLLTGL